MDESVPELLDESRLEGAVAISRLLGPALEAALVDRSSLQDAALAIEQCCQEWAGALTPLIPGTRGDVQLAAPWDSYLTRCEVDSVCSRDLVTFEGVVSNFYSHTLRQGASSGNFILKVLHARGESHDAYRPIHVARPGADDPWFIAYAGCLGLLPPHPHTSQLHGHGFVESAEFSDFIPTDFLAVDTPSAEDLLMRLQDREADPPAYLSLMGLGVIHAPRNMSLFQADPIFPFEARIAEEVGPNIVVLYEPGSVEDLCLIWNLRAAHALPKGYPLAIPTTADISAALDVWQENSALTIWQFRRPRLVLVSASVEIERLQAIADSVPEIHRVVSTDEILQPPRLPGRFSTDVATFADGRATVAAWGATDREALRLPPQPWDWYRLKARIRPRDRLLPPSRWMQRRSGVWGGPMGGCWETPTTRPDDIAQVSWPSGWTVVASLARDHGLLAKPSTAGLAAAALLRRLGSLHALGPMLDPRLVQTLHRLCEKEGMSWFRHELRELAKRVHSAARPHDALSKQIDELMVCRGETEDGQFLTYGGLRSMGLFSKNTRLAGQWLTWAEGAGLLVRGVMVKCDGCGADSWRAMGELSQSMTCRGCGDLISRPYPPEQLAFNYRASELLTQVTRWDALVHLLAMRYFCSLFAGRPDNPSRLYGAYPGVDFYHEKSGEHIGEADLILVFATGEVALGECKRSALGLKDADIAKLEDLSVLTGAEWSFVATLARAVDCPPVWRDSQRRLPDPPRFVLTAEHLYQSGRFRELDTDPFAWPEEDTDDPSWPASDWTQRLFDWQEKGGGWDAWIATD